MAVAISSFYLLFFASIVVCWKFRDQFYLLIHEKIALALVACLIFAAMIRPNALDGIEFVIAEYRTLWMVPFIGFAISAVLTKKELLMPLILGSIFNILGSLCLALKKIDLTLSPSLGLVAAPESPYSLGGKFVQSTILAFWSGICFSFIALKRNLTTVIILFVWLGTLYHGLILVNSRSGVILSILLISMISFVVAGFKYRRFGPAIAFVSVVAISALALAGMNQQILTIFYDLSGFIFEGNARGSLGQRLQSMQSVTTLNFDELAFGVGGGNWLSKMNYLLSRGEISSWYVEWQDFHSEFVWLTMLGGLFSLVIYLLLLVPIVSRSTALLVRGDWFGGGMGFALMSVLGVYGAFNSVFTNLREAHIVALGLIVVSAWFRFYISKPVIE